jgi:citrate synthase
VEEDSMSPYLAALLEAHANAAKNESASHVAFVVTATTTSDFGRALIAALATLSGFHAPITGARAVLYKPGFLDYLLTTGARVPGWGNSFYKTGIDPALTTADSVLRAEHPEAAAHLDATTKRVEEHAKCVLFPNIAAYTAIEAELSSVPVGTELSILIHGRLPEWARHFAIATGTQQEASHEEQEQGVQTTPSDLGQSETDTDPGGA